MKIVVGDPTDGIAPRGQRPGRAKLPSLRKRNEQGRQTTMYAVDISSATLTNDMLTVFRRSAARGRRETRSIRQKLGVAAE